MMLNFRDFVNEKLDADQRLANKLFRKEVHALMSDKDANTLIQARSELDRWRDKYYKSDFRLEREAKEQQRKS